MAERRHYIVIGAMKSATTTLHAALATHPSVAVPRRKELDFFSDPARPRRPDDLAAGYERLFRGCDAPVVGEASPSYSMAPTHPGVPEAIASVLPDVRLVYCLRDPLDRMRSHYRHEVLRSRERRPAPEALEDESYLVPSRYGHQLAAYRQHFHGAQIAVVASSALIGDPVPTIASLLAFLDLEPTPELAVGAAFTSEERVAFAPGTERARYLPGARRLAALLPSGAKQAIARRLPGSASAAEDSARLFATTDDWVPSGDVLAALDDDRAALVDALAGCVAIGELPWVRTGGAGGG